MGMDRRNFLKIAFTAAAVTAVPVALTKALEQTLPVIYADGAHDDWAGLQAAIDGRDFICASECVQVFMNRVSLFRGHFLISRTLRVGGATRLKSVGNTYEAIPELSGPMLELLDDASGNSFFSDHFVGKSTPGCSVIKFPPQFLSLA